jgi:peptidoglycan/LPS O-acetylase OafA/YrhL
MSETQHPRRIGRSISALLAGIFAGGILTVATDIVLHVTGVFPPWGQSTGDALLLFATAYRIPFNIAGSYVVAWLAPDRPMQHALISGVVGVVACTVGAVTTWDRGLGSHWYPLALIALAIPCACAGGRLRVMQLRGHIDR